MIAVHDVDNRAIYLAPGAIAEVREAGTASQWHGIRAYIKTFDGRTIEARESAQEVASQIGRQSALD